MSDLAVVGMDPGFGGGVWALTDAFLTAAEELDRHPTFGYPAHPSLAEMPRTRPGTSVPFARLDSLSRVLSARALAPPLRAARSVWVVAATAPYGYPALRSGRPYACWLAAGVSEETAGRAIGLRRSRRIALAVNRPALCRLEGAVIRGASQVYAISPSSRAELARAGGIDEERVGILPIPVDLDRLTPAPDERWRAGLRSPLLVFVGRGNDPRKNARLLLEALPMVRAHIPGARLRFVGTPPPGPLPDGAEAVGHVESVAEHLREASLFLLPSRHEGFGIVAAEALACGVPVLTTPSGGPEALVRDSGGGVVLGGFSAEELAAAAVALLDDAASLSTMRRAGREYVEREHSPARFRALLGQALDR
jgi:glycosyltransferase involved in cell wall biosynthesis